MKKTLTLLSFCFIATSSFAVMENTANNSTMNNQAVQSTMPADGFNQFKQQRIDGIKARINIGQLTMNCVQAAQTPADMKACDDTARTAMQTLRENSDPKMLNMNPATPDASANAAMSAPNATNMMAPAASAPAMNATSPNQMNTQAIQPTNTVNSPQMITPSNAAPTTPVTPTTSMSSH